MAKISQEKREELEAVLGADLAVTILDQLDANAEMLKQAGVRAKASAKPEDGEDEEEETTEAATTPEDEEAPAKEVVPADEEDDEEEEDMEKAAKPSLDGGEYELVLTEADRLTWNGQAFNIRERPTRMTGVADAQIVAESGVAQS